MAQRAIWDDLAALANQVIAAKLARLVPASGAIALDSSPASRGLAARLRSERGLDVITNGVSTFAALQGREGIRAILTGGHLQAGTQSLVGSLARQSAARLATSRLFISPTSVDLSLGGREVDLEDAEIKVAFAGVTSEVVLAAGSWGLGSPIGAPVVPWSSVSFLVTELDQRDHRLDPYRARAEIV